MASEWAPGKMLKEANVWEVSKFTITGGKSIKIHSRHTEDMKFDACRSSP